MDVAEALEWLGDGHSVLTQEAAELVCDAFGVPFPSDRVMRWESSQDAFNRYGFFTDEDGPGVGVAGLGLSYHIADVLGLGAPGRRFSGKGFQAQGNVRAIAGNLGLK